MTTRKKVQTTGALAIASVVRTKTLIRMTISTWLKSVIWYREIIVAI